MLFEDLWFDKFGYMAVLFWLISSSWSKSDKRMDGSAKMLTLALTLAFSAPSYVHKFALSGINGLIGFSGDLKA